MSWLRIDENTYIDDSLVTCAEYKLFIDEMREQGKYYQPDHWTSYQFPEGQAREPILGVRPNDAKAFCEWLMQQNNDEWDIRLPSQQEGIDNPIKATFQKPLGYWVNGSDGQVRFMWVGPVPKDARGIAFDLNLARTHDHYLDGILGYIRFLDSVLDRALDHALDRALDLDRVLDYTRALDRVSDLAFDLDDVLDLDRDLARELDLDRASNLAIYRALDRDLDRARDRACALYHDPDLDHAIDHAIYVARTHRRSTYYPYPPDVTRDPHRDPDFYLLHLARDRDSDRARAPDLSRARDPDRARDLYRALDLYVDIFTLKARIAGRSPAFEGIRLVKERIK